MGVEARDGRGLTERNLRPGLRGATRAGHRRATLARLVPLPASWLPHQTLSLPSALRPMVITTTMARYSIIINSDGSPMNMRTTMTTMMIMMGRRRRYSPMAQSSRWGPTWRRAARSTAWAAWAARQWPERAVECGRSPRTPPRQSASDPRGPLRAAVEHGPRAGPSQAYGLGDR